MDHGFSIQMLSFVIFLLVLGFNMPWIIPDLYFAHQDIPCVVFIPDGFVINLSTWLKVDGAIRITISLILLVISIAIRYSSDLLKNKIFRIIYPTIILMLVFTSIWTIVGSVMFWGHLNSTQVCYGGVKTYMFTFLICSNLVTGFLFCFAACKLSQSAGRQEMYRLLAE